MVEDGHIESCLHKSEGGLVVTASQKEISVWCWKQSHGAFVLQYDEHFLLTASFPNWNPGCGTANYLSVLRVLSLFFFCYGSPAERHSSQDNISAQLVKRWENSRHQKGQINCCLKSQAQHVWCRKALKMKFAYKGNDLESFLIWVYKRTQSFTVFYSSISHPACIFTVSHFSVLVIVCMHSSSSSLFCQNFYWFPFMLWRQAASQRAPPDPDLFSTLRGNWCWSSECAEGRQADTRTKLNSVLLIIIYAKLPFYQYVHKVAR